MFFFLSTWPLGISDDACCCTNLQKELPLEELLYFVDQFILTKDSKARTVNVNILLLFCASGERTTDEK